MSAKDLASLSDSFKKLKGYVDHASHGSGLSEFADWLDTVGEKSHALANGGLDALHNKFQDLKDSTDAVNAITPLTHPVEKQTVTTKSTATTLASSLVSAVTKVFRVDFNIGGGKTIPLYGDDSHAGMMQQFLSQLSNARAIAQGI